MLQGEYWLLDSVLEQRHQMSLLQADNVEAWFGREPHGLDREGLVTGLSTLFAAGDLIASDERGEFIPSPTELAGFLDGQADADYGLTPQGGARWEELSNPDWLRYIDETYGFEDSSGELAVRKPGQEFVGELIAADHQLLERYLEGVVFNGFLPHPQSVRWDTVEPWQVFYWKQLPRGERVRFQCLRGRPAPDEQIPEWFRELKHWYTRPEGE